MNEENLICSVNDVAKGEMKSFLLDGKDILIVNMDGNFYALDAVCNHMGGKLEKGHLKDNTVICPLHRCRYDVTTGKVTRQPGILSGSLGGKCGDQKKYEITIEDGNIYLVP